MKEESSQHLVEKKPFHYNAKIRQLFTELQEEDSSLVNKVSLTQGRKSNREKKDRRIAAKETRVRKKMYVQLLQKKITILQRKLQFAKEAKNQKQGNTVHTMIKDREALFITLTQSVQRKDNQKAKDCIDLLQFRYGIAGKDRIKAIEQLFSSVVSLLMPMHMRMLIQFPSRFMNMCKMLSQDRMSNLQKQLKLASRVKQSYQQALTKLFQAKNSLVQLNGIYQDISNRIREAMGTRQISLILSSIDIERSKNEDYKILFPMSFWNNLANPGEKEEINEKLSMLNDSLDMGDAFPFFQKDEFSILEIQ